jgi:hypothetical protein
MKIFNRPSVPHRSREIDSGRYVLSAMPLAVGMTNTGRFGTVQERRIVLSKVITKPMSRYRLATSIAVSDAFWPLKFSIGLRFAARDALDIYISFLRNLQ